MIYMQIAIPANLFEYHKAKAQYFKNLAFNSLTSVRHFVFIYLTFIKNISILKFQFLLHQKLILQFHDIFHNCLSVVLPVW